MTIITTQRLIIRHFKEEDAAALFNYLSSPRTPCFKDEKLHSLAEAEVDVAKRASDPTQFDYLFKVKGARRLYAWVEDYNYSSQKLCERLLMRREGCFKEFVSFENEEGKARYDDTYIYALLHKEWTK